MPQNDDQQGKVIPFRNPFIWGLFGPAIILLAFGQATGELIHWPYLVVKYKLFFLFVLIPACIIQYPIFSYLARHTIVTGESFFSNLLKSNKAVAIIIWAVFVLTTIWIASYTASGGVAIVKLINLAGASLDVPTWSAIFAIGLNFIYFVILVISRRTYRLISVVMSTFAALSLIGITILFIWTIINAGFDPNFLVALTQFKFSLPENWNPADWKLLITAIIFAGLGGLWNLLYSIWVRNAGMGMANYNNDEFFEYQNTLPDIKKSQESIDNYKKSLSLLHKDLLVGLGGNALMLLMLAYITYIFFPANQPAPAGLNIITTLADAVSYGSFTLSIMFYICIGLFMTDTWLAAADALSKVHANFILGASGKATVGTSAVKVTKLWYFLALLILWLWTIVSSYIAEPQKLNYLNGVLSALGSVLLIFGILLNEQAIKNKYEWLPRSGLMMGFLLIAFIFYIALGLMYLILTW